MPVFSAPARRLPAAKSGAVRVALGFSRPSPGRCALLYEVVERRRGAFFAHLDEQGRRRPGFVRDEHMLVPDGAWRFVHGKARLQRAPVATDADLER
ncbi:MAG: hypothetical protein GKR94_20005 [Gammaproteobacteria bacterium]|nr:hypothetical protein [Gammaproteobacteria bacterium]